MRKVQNRTIYTLNGPEIVPSTIACMRRGCQTQHDPLRGDGWTNYCEPHRLEERAIDRLETCDRWAGSELRP